MVTGAHRKTLWPPARGATTGDHLPELLPPATMYFACFVASMEVRIYKISNCFCSNISFLGNLFSLFLSKYNSVIIIVVERKIQWDTGREKLDNRWGIAS
jgi:hypothetical protein